MSRGVYILQGIAAGFFFGTSSIFIRFLPRLDVYSIGFYRLIIAILFMAIFNMLVFGWGWLRIYRRLFKQLTLLGMIIGFHFIFFISAVKNTTILNTTVLVNTTPAITLLLSWILLRQKPKSIQVLGLMLTMLGASAIALLETSISPGNLIGDLQALLAALLWALYLMLGKSVRSSANVMWLMVMIYLVSGLMIGVVGLATRGGIAYPVGGEWIMLLGIAFFPTFLGHTLHFSSLKYLTPFQTSVLALLEPIVATTLAGLLLREIPHPAFYILAGITMVGIYLVLR